jgi:hypothetical protein
MKSKKKKLLIFVHIPKTAGSTFRKICTRQFRKSEKIDLGMRIRKGRPLIHDNKTFYSLVQGLLKDLPSNLKSKLALVFQGHMAYGLHEFFPQPASYITFLRDPVKRVISHYLHTLRSPTYIDREYLLRVGFEGYVTDEQFREAVDNVQTRLLCGEGGVPKEGQLTQKDLAKAKERLRNNFAFVGITERFDESLVLAKRELGWRNVYYHKWNVSRRKVTPEELSPHALELAKKKNAFDQKVYQFACELHEQAVKRYGREELQKNITAFQKKNKLFGKWYLLKLALTSPPSAYFRKLQIILSSLGATVTRKRDKETG